MRLGHPRGPAVVLEAVVGGAMATEFQMVIEGKPRALAKLGAALGDGGVNIEALLGLSREGRSTVQFVPNNPTFSVAAHESPTWRDLTNVQLDAHRHPV